MDSIAELIYKLENELLKPEIRNSKEEIEKLISDDFIEFCSSGRTYKYKKGDTFYEENVSYEITDFDLRRLSSDCVLATYKLIKNFHKDNSKNCSLRSSIWKCILGNWKIIFHQGTSIDDI